MTKLVDYMYSIRYLSLLHKRFTEQRPGPLTESSSKGWALPDPVQQRLNRTDRIRDAYASVLPIKSAVDTISNSLFGHDTEDLTLETESSEARQLLHGHFDGRHYGESALPQFVYTIRSLLSNIGAKLLLVGRVYYAMVWSDDGKRLVNLKPLPPETMKAQWRGGRVWRYRQQYSIFTSNEMIQQATPRVHWSLGEEVRGTTFYFQPHEVFFLEWPFDPNGRRGYPPAREAVKHLSRWKSYW